MQQMKSELTQEKRLNMPNMNLFMLSSTIVCGPLLHDGRLSVPLQKDIENFKYKKEKLGVLKYNIQIRYLGIGWD